MTRTCSVCGGETRTGTRYTARCDDRTVLSFPSIECTSCGSIQPDSERISALPIEDLPPLLQAKHRSSAPRHVGDTLSPPPPTVAEKTGGNRD
jgi:hypothetical protein